MKVSIEWLREFLPDLDKKAALDILPRLGLGVEEVIDVGNKNIITARVEKISRHRKVSNLLTLKLKGNRPYRVVCGAKNFKEGDVVLLALPGAEVGGRRIEPTNFSGIRSEGMLVSEAELGISESSEGIIVLAPGTDPGRCFNDLFDTTILDLEITPNRGDCESVIGIARELAIGLKRNLDHFRLQPPRLRKGPVISIQDQQDCPRYTAMIIEDVDVTDSPFDVKWRLFHHGIRSINSLVDITNYVMLMLGQPLHAFDLALIKGRVRVRRAKENERMTTLDGTRLKLDKRHLVIADQEDPIALAGVIGGKKAEIRRTTKRILLESATFRPEVVRMATRGLMIESQSGRRFERGTDPAMPPLAAQFAAQLIPGRPRSFTDIRVPIRRKKVTCDHKRISRFLGLKLKGQEVINILKRLDFRPKPSRGRITVSIPGYRRDVAEECDVAEEIARVYGYDRIPSKISRSSGEGILPRQMVITRRLRTFMIAKGFYECRCFAPTSKEMINLLELGRCVEIRNPLNERFTHLRSSLVTSLVEVLAINYRNGNPDVRVFEIGRVYIPARPKPEENHHLGIIVGGRRDQIHWSGGDKEWDFFDAKGILELITRLLDTGPFTLQKSKVGIFDDCSYQIMAGGSKTGCIGRISEQILDRFDVKGRYFFMEVNLDRLFQRISPPLYIPYPRFPKVRRDLAFLVDETISAGELIDQIRKFGGPLLTEVVLFDFYRGKGFPEGKVSLGFRLTFQPEERTLTEDEIKGFIYKVVGGLSKRFGVQLRDKEVDVGGT